MRAIILDVTNDEELEYLDWETGDMYRMKMSGSGEVLQRIRKKLEKNGPYPSIVVSTDPDNAPVLVRRW